MLDYGEGKEPPQWLRFTEVALQQLNEMVELRMAPPVAAFISDMGAGAPMSAWEIALRLLNVEMPRFLPDPDSCACSEVLRACHASQQRSLFPRLVREPGGCVAQLYTRQRNGRG